MYNEAKSRPEIRISSPFSMHSGIGSCFRKVIYKLNKTRESALEYKGLGIKRFVNRKGFVFGLNVHTNPFHILNSTGMTFRNILSTASRHAAGITIHRNIGVPFIEWMLVLITGIQIIREIRNTDKVLSYLDHVSIYIGALIFSATFFSLSTNTEGSIKNLLRFKASFSSISQFRKHFNLAGNEIDAVLYLCGRDRDSALIHLKLSMIETHRSFLEKRPAI